ncbi:MAG: response regulator [Candidatus Omnitrophica bacterium]|nr:response regulator [Candidatus Omnitrophota bacterium]
MAENQNGKAILLVDDDPDYCELTRKRLEASGYQVSCASNGQEALELLEGEYEPRLIIMDIEMPDKNGLATLIHMNVRRKIGSNDEKMKIPVLVATGLQGEKIRKVMMDQEVSGYIRKPYGSEELIQTVKGLIG